MLCNTTISLPSSYRIRFYPHRLNFSDVHTGACAQGDFLDFRDLGYDNSQRFSCTSEISKERVPMFESSGSRVEVMFTSDHVIQGEGFQVFYMGVPSCRNETYNVSSGSVASVNHPRNYPNNQECFYTINVDDQDDVIELTFQKFMTESDRTHDAMLRDRACTRDFVEVFDGKDRHKVCGDWSGKEHLLLFRSRSNVLVFSDRDWESDFYWPDGTKVSFTNWFPGFPLSGARGRVWGRQPSDDGQAGEDCVEMRRRFARPEKGHTVMPNFLWNDRDSKPQLIPPEPVKCDQNISLTTDQPWAHVHSVGYPSNYPDHTNCSYFIHAPPTARIEIEFFDFHLENESDSGCEYDFLEISGNFRPIYGQPEHRGVNGKRCGDWSRKVKLLQIDALYAGNTSIVVQDTTAAEEGYTCLVVKVTDSVVMDNVTAVTRIMTSPTDCRSPLPVVCHQTNPDLITPVSPDVHFLNDSTGRLQPRLGNDNYSYTNDDATTWVLQAPPQHRVLVVLENVEVELQDECLYDWIVLNNTTRTSRICGQETTVRVPIGYRIDVTFLHFRLAESAGCDDVLDIDDVSLGTDDCDLQDTVPGFQCTCDLGHWGVSKTTDTFLTQHSEDASVGAIVGGTLLIDLNHRKGRDDRLSRSSSSIGTRRSRSLSPNGERIKRCNSTGHYLPRQDKHVEGHWSPTSSLKSRSLDDREVFLDPESGGLTPDADFHKELLAEMKKLRGKDGGDGGRGEETSGGEGADVGRHSDDMHLFPEVIVKSLENLHHEDDTSDASRGGSPITTRALQQSLALILLQQKNDVDTGSLRNIASHTGSASLHHAHSDNSLRLVRPDELHENRLGYTRSERHWKMHEEDGGTTRAHRVNLLHSSENCHAAVLKWRDSKDRITFDAGGIDALGSSSSDKDFDLSRKELFMKFFSQEVDLDDTYSSEEPRVKDSAYQTKESSMDNIVFEPSRDKGRRKSLPSVKAEDRKVTQRLHQAAVKLYILQQRVRKARLSRDSAVNTISEDEAWPDSDEISPSGYHPRYSWLARKPGTCPELHVGGDEDTRPHGIREEEEHESDLEVPRGLNPTPETLPSRTDHIVEEQYEPRECEA
nr:hypothetical protein BaRGS_018923 [Batillaria attramentaria]